MKKFFFWLFLLGITVLTLVYALWDVDFNELGTKLSDGDYRLVLPIWVLLFLFFWLKALRWRVILRPLGNFSVNEVTPPMMMGYAGNNVLPGHLGEFVRIGIFAHRFSMPISGVFTTLVVERILDILTIFLLFEASIAFVDSAPKSLQVGAWFIAPILAALIAAIAFMLWKPGIVHALWNFFSRWLPMRLQKKGSAIIENVMRAFASIKSLSSLFALILLSFLQWIFMAGIVWLSVEAYGQTISWELAFIVVGTTALAILVPSAPGFFGTIQAVFVFALKPFGIAETTAFAASVVFSISQWIPVTAVGFYYFIAGGLRLAEVREELEEAEEASLG